MIGVFPKPHVVRFSFLVLKGVKGGRKPNHFDSNAVVSKKPDRLIPLGQAVRGRTQGM